MSSRAEALTRPGGGDPEPLEVGAHGSAVFPSDHFGVVFDFERR